MSITIEELKEELFKDPILKRLYEDNKIYSDIEIAFLRYMVENGMTQKELADKLLISEEELNGIFNQDFNHINAWILIESLKIMGYKLKIEISDN